MHTVAARKAARRSVRGGNVYVGKEGGWLEGKVEVRHSREWDWKEDKDVREGENGRLICRALSYLQYAFYSRSSSNHDIPSSSHEGPAIALRRGAPKRDADNRVNRRTCGVETRVNIFVTSPVFRAVKGSDNSVSVVLLKI